MEINKLRTLSQYQNYLDDSAQSVDEILSSDISIKHKAFFATVSHHDWMWDADNQKMVKEQCLLSELELGLDSEDFIQAFIPLNITILVELLNRTNNLTVYLELLNQTEKETLFIQIKNYFEDLKGDLLIQEDKISYEPFLEKVLDLLNIEVFIESSDALETEKLIETEKVAVELFFREGNVWAKMVENSSLNKNDIQYKVDETIKGLGGFFASKKIKTAVASLATLSALGLSAGELSEEDVSKIMSNVNSHRLTSAVRFQKHKPGKWKYIDQQMEQLGIDIDEMTPVAKSKIRLTKYLKWAETDNGYEWRFGKWKANYVDNGDSYDVKLIESGGAHYVDQEKFVDWANKVKDALNQARESDEE